MKNTKIINEHDIINECYPFIKHAIHTITEIPDEVWNDCMSLSNSIVCDLKEGNNLLNQACDAMEAYLGIKTDSDND